MSVDHRTKLLVGFYLLDIAVEKREDVHVKVNGKFAYDENGKPITQTGDTFWHWVDYPWSSHPVKFPCIDVIVKDINMRLGCSGSDELEEVWLDDTTKNLLIARTVYGIHHEDGCRWVAMSNNEPLIQAERLANELANIGIKNIPIKAFLYHQIS